MWLTDYQGQPNAGYRTHAEAPQYLDVTVAAANQNDIPDIGDLLHQKLNNSGVEVLIEVLEVGLKLPVLFKFLDTSTYVWQVIVGLFLVHQSIRINIDVGIVSGYVVERGV